MPVEIPKTQEEWAAVQNQLYQRGLYGGPIDGSDNPEVRSAILKFQQNTDLVNTGIADQPTMDKLWERPKDPEPMPESMKAKETAPLSAASPASTGVKKPEDKNDKDEKKATGPASHAQPKVEPKVDPKKK